MANPYIIYLCTNNTTCHSNSPAKSATVFRAANSGTTNAGTKTSGTEDPAAAGSGTTGSVTATGTGDRAIWL